MPFKPMLSKRHENDFGHIVKLMGTRGNDVKVKRFQLLDWRLLKLNGQ